MPVRLEGAGGRGGSREAHSQEDDEGRAKGEQREHGGVRDQRRVHCVRRRRCGGSRGRLGAGGGRLGFRHGLLAISLGVKGEEQQQLGGWGDLTGKDLRKGVAGWVLPIPI